MSQTCCVTPSNSLQTLNLTSHTTWKPFPIWNVHDFYPHVYLVSIFINFYQYTWKIIEEISHDNR